MAASSILASRDLARLWSEAATLVSLHSSSCGCGGAAHAVHIDAGRVAGDILDYLTAKYQAAGRSALVAFVKQREPGSAAAFERWLAALDAAPIADGDLALLKADLTTALDSMRQH
jgi:hypothetical protein